MSGTQAGKNVLLIMTDEWRAQNIGYNGDPEVNTPNIDKLAGESVNYCQAIAGTPICCPSRASFITGQYPSEHGVYINDVPLQPQGTTIAEVFQQHGYRTGYIGKWHLNGSPEGIFEARSEPIPPERRFGFEYWKVLECTHDYNNSAYYDGESTKKKYWPGYDAFGQTDDAIDFIGQQTEQPYFLALSYGPPHFPLHTAPQEYRERYSSAEPEVRGNVPEWAREEALEDLRGYFAHMEALDDCIGKLLEQVDPENTIVVFTSDHGDMMWSQGLQHKLTPWEEAVRIPLLVRAPGVAPGESDQLFNSPDLMPTVLGYVGLPIPESVTGEDLSRSESQPSSAWLSAPVAYSSLRRTGLSEYRGVRNHRYTYVCTRTGPWLLYDNYDDPFQLNNRCDDPELAEIQTALHQQLEQWMHRLSDEFRESQYYLERDGLTHYFEVNEPLGRAGNGQWRSTDERAWHYSIDTPMAHLLEDAEARKIVEQEVPDLLKMEDTFFERRSLRLLAMLEPEQASDQQLRAADSRLAELGPLPLIPEDMTAKPAWPPQRRLTPRKAV